MGKTGGRRGTNQYAVKGVSQASRQSVAVLDDLATEVIQERWGCDRGEWVRFSVVRRADGHLVEVEAEDAALPPVRLRRLSRPVSRGWR